MTTNLDTDTLEWAAQWIRDSLKGETNERVIKFGNNMAMTLRAAVQPAASTPTEVCPSCRADQIKQGKGVAGQLCPQCSLRPRNAAASAEAQDERKRNE